MVLYSFPIDSAVPFSCRVDFLNSVQNPFTTSVTDPPRLSKLSEIHQSRVCPATDAATLRTSRFSQFAATSASLVNIVIRIEYTDDPETAMESTFHECDPSKILADEKTKWCHGLLRQFMEMTQNNQAEP